MIAAQLVLAWPYFAPVNKLLVFGKLISRHMHRTAVFSQSYISLLHSFSTSHLLLLIVINVAEACHDTPYSSTSLRWYNKTNLKFLHSSLAFFPKFWAKCDHCPLLWNSLIQYFFSSIKDLPICQMPAGHNPPGTEFENGCELWTLSRYVFLDNWKGKTISMIDRA